MKQIIWSKTLLTAYRYFERIAKAVDNLVMKEALGSLNFKSSLLGVRSAEEVSNKILDYTEKKIALINAKLLIEKALYGIDKKHAVILVKRYLQNKKVSIIIRELGIPRRSFYRKLDNALKSFSCLLCRMGYDYKKLETMFLGQKWLMKIYSNFETSIVGENEEFELDDCDSESIFLQNVYKGNRVSLFA